MISLLQVILLLGANNPLQINIIRHFDHLKTCEKQIFNIHKRYKNSDLILTLEKDDENITYLKVNDIKDSSIVYWMCKKSIF